LQSTSKPITNINDIGNIIDKLFLKDTDTKLVSSFVPYYFYIVYDLGERGKKYADTGIILDNIKIIYCSFRKISYEINSLFLLKP